MKVQHMTIICLMSFSSGCALLGSRAVVYDKVLLQKVDNVLIMTLNTEQNLSLNIENILDSTFTNTIKKRLSQNNYPHIKFLDKYSSADIKVSNGNISINNPDRFRTYEAIMVFERKLQWPMGISADAKVEITIYSIKSGKPIMYVSHNTTFGNSYWMNPMLPQTLIDATNGAINKLIKKLDKYK